MSQRKCSFCKVSGHTINTCHDPAAEEIKRDATFKCNIALQYLGTGVEDQMYQTICSWFASKSVNELKVMISAKQWRPVGTKVRLVSRAIWAYYFYQSIQHRPYDEVVINRFICRGRYHGNIANGIDQERAREIFDRELSQRDQQRRDVEQPRAPPKIPIIDGLTEESVDCPICFETETDVIQTNCGHLFCRPCIMTHTKGVATACPCCRTEIDLFIVK